MENRVPSTLAERDGALRENWYIACLSCELRGDRPIQRILYDEPYVLFRDEAGKAVCLPDRCLHRNALLSEGRVIDGKLVCGYHGWNYDREGAVTHIPSEGPRSKPGAHLCMPKVPTVEQDDCIWIWTGKGAPRSKAPPFRFPFYKTQGFSTYYMITDFENEVTHLVENFMDVPHTVFVHAGWFRSPSQKKVPIRVETEQGKVLVTYVQPKDSIGFFGRILNPRGLPMTHTDQFIFPNLTRVEYHFGDAERRSTSFIICSQCTPVSTLKSRVYTEISYRVGFMTRLLHFFFQFYTRRVIQQDVEIMANQGRSFTFNLNPEFRSTDADVVHTEIEKLRRFGVKDDPKAFTAENRVEREIWI